MGELGEVLGRKQARLQLGEECLVLRPLTLNDLVEYEEAVGELGQEQSGMAGLRYELYLAARRGGSDRTLEQIGELVEVGEVERVESALAELVPGEKEEPGN